jgi:hypothetical protein
MRGPTEAFGGVSRPIGLVVDLKTPGRKEERRLVRAERRPAADGLRRHLDHLQRCQVKTDPRAHLVYGFLATAPNVVVGRGADKEDKAAA